jgi:CRP/FNR family transcriptional regulator
MKIEEFYIFKNLDDQTLKKLNTKITKTRYKQNSIVFYKDDSSDRLHILVSGSVKIYKHNTNNEEMILHLFKTQSLIAEMATFEKIPYPANCMAQSETEIWTIPRDDFLELLSTNTLISLEIISSMSSKIRHLENSINLNMLKNSTQRVASLILNNPNIFKQTTRIKIASLLNMTPETLSRVIKKFKEEDYIGFENKAIKVKNNAKLKELS